MTDKPANKMWGGRFAMSPAEVMEEINASIGFDKVWPLTTSAPPRRTPPCWPRRASSARTTPARSPPASTGSLAEIESGQVHVLARARRHAHERREPPQGADRRAGRARCTRRARATTRWRPTSGSTCATGSTAPIAALGGAAARCSPARRRRTPRLVMPGFTHLQPAQPVTFGHHLLAYVEMLGARPRPASPMPARGSTSARWAPPRWPAPRFPSTGT